MEISYSIARRVIALLLCSFTSLTAAESVFGAQPSPELHTDESYTIVGADGSDIVVTPATVKYNYELYDGQNIYTDIFEEEIPNFDFDYAVLSLNGIRNINRETGEPVSLDEVYFHHFSFIPIGMLGSESLTRDEKSPFMDFLTGTAFHVRKKDFSHFYVNAHLISNKDLAEIDGSLALARKKCNECYYAPGKGSDCTPEMSGTFFCCGDSPVCRDGEEICGCETNSPVDTSKTTKYEVSVHLLISKEIEKFKRVDIWTIMTPSCGSMMSYPIDHPCNKLNYNINNAQGAGYHNIAENNNEPETVTKSRWIAPSSGIFVYLQAHLHSGGVSATLLLNDQVICAAGTVYGNNSDVATNARNEQNHLILVESCPDIGAGIRFEEGDVITIETIYYAGTDDKRFKGVGAGGEHKNVMSYFFMGTLFDSDKEWQTKEQTSILMFNNFDSFIFYEDTEEEQKKQDEEPEEEQEKQGRTKKSKKAKGRKIKTGSKRGKARKL